MQDASIMNQTTIQKNFKSDHGTVSLLQLVSKHTIFNIHVYIYLKYPLYSSISDID